MKSDKTWTREITFSKRPYLLTQNIPTFPVLKIITLLQDSLFRSSLINITCAVLTAP